MPPFFFVAFDVVGVGAGEVAGLDATYDVIDDDAVHHCGVGVGLDEVVLLGDAVLLETYLRTFADVD